MTDGDEILIELNFAPAWARQMPGAPLPPQKAATPEERKPKKRPPPWARRKNAAAPHEPEQSTARKRAPYQPSSAPLPPVNVVFMPGRLGIKPFARKLAKSGRAYPLRELAAMFLSKPEYFAVKLEIEPPAEGAQAEAAAPELFQCAECKDVFATEEKARAHALSAHFTAFYSSEQQETEPPKGNFMCVAKCRLSGELLGPPNHHEYHERLLEIHRTRFPHMPLEEYRQYIVNDTDPNAIETWRQQACRRTSYKTLRAAETKTFTRLSEVEEHFLRVHAANAVKAGRRFIMPGRVVPAMRDEKLKKTVLSAWEKEKKAPWKMGVALKYELRRFGLKLFRTKERMTFVSAIVPNPIKPEETEPGVGRVLKHLMAEPGCTKQQLAAALVAREDGRALSEEEIFRHVHWLKEKGHIVEFFDGKLAAAIGRPAREKTEQLAEEPAREDGAGGNTG